MEDCVEEFNDSRPGQGIIALTPEVKKRQVQKVKCGGKKHVAK